MGILIGYAATPLPPDTMLPWIQSFRRHCPNHRVILLADPPENYAELAKYDMEIVPANLRTNPGDIDTEEKYRGVVSVYKDRWEEVQKLGLSQSEIVLLTDTRDVFFQRDPFEQIDPYALTVATEAVKLGHDLWNIERLKKYYPDNVKEVENFPSICAGVLGGPYGLVKLFAKLVRTKIANRTGMADQGAFNIVLRTSGLPWDFLPYSMGWCCHCAQTIAPWVPPDKHLFEEKPALMKNGELWTKSGKPFAIVHHWPMVPQLRHFGDVHGLQPT